MRLEEPVPLHRGQSGGVVELSTVRRDERELARVARDAGGLAAPVDGLAELRQRPARPGGPRRGQPHPPGRRKGTEALRRAAAPTRPRARRAPHRGRAGARGAAAPCRGRRGGPAVEPRRERSSPRPRAERRGRRGSAPPTPSPPGRSPRCRSRAAGRRGTAARRARVRERGVASRRKRRRAPHAARRGRPSSRGSRRARPRSRVAAIPGRPANTVTTSSGSCRSSSAAHERAASSKCGSRTRTGPSERRRREASIANAARLDRDPVLQHRSLHRGDLAERPGAGLPPGRAHRPRLRLDRRDTGDPAAVSVGQADRARAGRGHREGQSRLLDRAGRDLRLDQRGRLLPPRRDREGGRRPPGASRGRARLLQLPPRRRGECRDRARAEQAGRVPGADRGAELRPPPDRVHAARGLRAGRAGDDPLPARAGLGPLDPDQQGVPDRSRRRLVGGVPRQPRTAVGRPQVRLLEPGPADDPGARCAVLLPALPVVLAGEGLPRGRDARPVRAPDLRLEAPRLRPVPTDVRRCASHS